MTVFETHGTTTRTAKELSDLLADRLAVTVAERESSYLGIYFRATLADTTRRQVQPNAIPGDDGEDDLYKDEYPDVPVLLLVTTPAAPSLSTMNSRRSKDSPDSHHLEAEQPLIHKS